MLKPNIGNSVADFGKLVETSAQKINFKLGTLQKVKKEEFIPKLAISQTCKKATLLKWYCFGKNMGEALGFETTSPNVIIGCWTASILLHFIPTIKSNSGEGDIQSAWAPY